MEKIFKTVAFDLDDVLCERPEDKEDLGVQKYNFCTPIQINIDLCNKYFEEGHKIIIYTARGMTQFSGNLDKILENLYDLTETQLKSWGVKYHELRFGKLHYDILFDDKAIQIDKTGEFASLEKNKVLHRLITDLEEEIDRIH